MSSIRDMTFARTVNWGDALALEMFKTPGGLKRVVDAITDVLGPSYGTRNTFAKLLRIEDPAHLGARDRWRAWLLLTAIDQNPEEWGIDRDMAPRYMDAETLRWDLVKATRAASGRPVSSGWRSRRSLRLVESPADPALPAAA